MPTTGVYRIEAWGAEGGTQTPNGAGGKGAHVRGDVAPTQGDVLKVLVGQKGKTAARYEVGGGGTFVVKAVGNVALIVAGGGAPGNCGHGGPGGGYQGGDAGGSGVGGVPYGTGGKSLTTGATKVQEDGIKPGDGQVKVTLL